ncbi:MAG: CRISPR-associated autoregulator, DevR family [Desulfonauticus sp. 38_4375]|nr:MAG: CRISPR-associated autoregulator, DevR family [Desulfonauticus sp. 38_4375]
MKAIAIGYLTKVSLANLNASHTEGNVMVTKKVTLPDGSSVPYISGQAVRRMLRDRLEDLGWPLSEPFSNVSGQEVTPPAQPWNYIDEDIFGYMDASGAKRRTSPVRVSSLIGLFRFHGDRDLGTRSFEKFGKTAEAGGNMFETEIYANLFKGNILVELDRMGIFLDSELGKLEQIPPNCSKKDLPPEKWGPNRWALELNGQEKIKRLQAFHDALKYLWGGGRTARLLADLSPKFIAIIFLKIKHPVFLEAIKVDFEPEKGGYILKYESILEVIEKFSNQCKSLFFGIESNVFGNESEIKEKLGAIAEVTTISEAINKAKEEIGQK